MEVSDKGDPNGSFVSGESEWKFENSLHRSEEWPMNEERRSIVRSIVKEALQRKELMIETKTKKHKERDAEYAKNFKYARLKEILRAHDHIADNLTVARGVHPQDDYAQGPISHQSFGMAVKSVENKLNKRKQQ